MSKEMADPHAGMISFQNALREGILDIYPVPNYIDLFAHLDEPTPGTQRFTYVRLTEDRQTVVAFVAFIMNGQIDDWPCVAAGYAVPEEFRGRGHGKKVLMDAIDDLLLQAGKNGQSVVYVEAVIEVTNIASQKVAESALAGAVRDEIIDSASGKLACRYTSRYDTSLLRLKQ